MEPGACGRCGGPNPGIAATCQWCGATLTPAPLPIVPSGYRPLSLPEAPRGPSTSPAAAVVGVILILFGILLLVAAGVVSQNVASFNHACSQNPTCQGQSEPDPSGGFAAGGILLLIIGIIAIAYGARGYVTGPS